MFYASRDVDCHTCLNEVKRKAVNMLGLSRVSQFLFILRFLNKRAVMRDDGIKDEDSARNLWEICGIQQIEERSSAYSKRFKRGSTL